MKRVLSSRSVTIISAERRFIDGRQPCAQAKLELSSMNGAALSLFGQTFGFQDAVGQETAAAHELLMT
jgi:hypothetical protein